MPSAKPTTVDGGGDRLISVYPDELSFSFELEKQSFLDLKVVNNTVNHVAFKVKTTSPEKYFVRPNSSVIQPREECFVRGTNFSSKALLCLQIQIRENFLKMISIKMVEVVEEIKLRVVYVYPNFEEISRGDNLGSTFDDSQDNDLVDLDQALQHLKTERDAAILQVQLLQKDFELLKRQAIKENRTASPSLPRLWWGLSASSWD